MANQDQLTPWRSLIEDTIRPGGGQNAPMTGGSLVVAGCGLSGVDGLPELEEIVGTADTVLFCVGNRLARAWLLSRRPDAFDLGQLYGDDKRLTTYIQMTETILAAPRAGRSALAIFYGHPGFFCAPGRWAVEQATADGISAVMYPGLSTLDYLVADLNFDPALPGMQVFEASVLLQRKFRLDPSLHVVLLQVGAIGFETGSCIKPEKQSLSHLQAMLIDAYGPDATVTHYIKAFAPTMPSICQRFRVGDLTMPTVVSRLSSASTLYLSPANGQTGSSPYAAIPGAEIQDALQALTEKAEEIGNTPVKGLPPILRFFYGLAVRPSMAAAFRTDPARVVQNPLFDGLSTRLKDILARKEWSSIRSLIWRSR